MSPLPVIEWSALRRLVRLLLADRRTQEATAFFELLASYVHRRVDGLARRTRALSQAEADEVVGEVLYQLMRGSLAAFRGGSLPELLGFVRIIADRTTWRVMRRNRRDTEIADRITVEGHEVLPRAERPDAHLEYEVGSPLGQADQSYLNDLLMAGSKAEFARRAGVSRAAVTQRVQRIEARIDQLALAERMRHEVWMRQAARQAVDAGAEPT